MPSRLLHLFGRKMHRLSKKHAVCLSAPAWLQPEDRVGTGHRALQPSWAAPNGCPLL